MSFGWSFDGRTTLDVSKVDWPLIIVRSLQGNRRHILEPLPNPNGSWDVMCHSVAWEAERSDMPSVEMCGRCEGAARNRIEHFKDQDVPENVYPWLRDLAEFIEGLKS